MDDKSCDRFPYAGMTQIRFQGVFSVLHVCAGHP